MTSTSLHGKYSNYHYCIVRECKNTSIKTPGKMWIRVPNEKNKRNTWLKLAERDPNSLSTQTQIYFCEDHFDLENDMENYTQYKIMGSVKRIRMKPNCIPSQFDCQNDRKRKFSSTIDEVQHTSYNKSAVMPLSDDEKQICPIEMSTSSFEQELLSQDDSRPSCTSSVKAFHNKVVQVQHNTQFCDQAVQIQPLQELVSCQDYDEVPVVVIKTECGVENAVTTKIRDARRERLQESVYGVGPLVKEEDDSMVQVKVEIDEVTVKQELDIGPTVLQSQKSGSLSSPTTHVQDDGFVTKKEDEADEVTVKQELDVGPTVLQPRNASRPLPPTARADSDSRPSTSSDYGASPAPLRIIPAQPAPRIEVQDDCSEEDSEVFSNASFVYDAKTDDGCRRVLKKRLLHDRSNTEDTSFSTQEGRSCKYCVKLQTERHRTFVSRPEADSRADGKRYEYCKYNTPSKSSIINYICTNMEENPYKCEQCTYSVSRVDNLKIRMRNHTSKKPYKCEQCEYSASRIRNIKRHMSTHTGEKPYKCKQCEYSASQLVHLKRHTRTHTGEKPYKCEQCEYSAPCLSNMKNHTRTHTGEKPYKCEQCEYSAAERNRLKVHKRIHTGEKPYKCKQCEYGASQLVHLKRHIRTHTNESPYKNISSVTTRLYSAKKHTHSQER